MKKKPKKNGFKAWFEKASGTITRVSGSPAAVLVALSVIVVWAVTGPLFGYSDTWQLVINTGTTIITFIMVFVIQHSQNKDTMAMQLKLNELIAAAKGASNRLVDIEDITEDELMALKKYYVKLADLSAKEKNILDSHSIDEAQTNHSGKINTAPKTTQKSK